MSCFIVTFFTTHQVIKAERNLKNNLEKVTTIPTPEHLSSDCGVSLKINTEKTTEQLKNIFCRRNLKYKHIAPGNKKTP